MEPHFDRVGVYVQPPRQVPFFRDQKNFSSRRFADQGRMDQKLKPSPMSRNQYCSPTEPMAVEL
jgi:hypothetical protein